MGSARSQHPEGDVDEFVSIVPGVSILGVLSNLNYEPWFALAEYVDNSIQSARKSLLLLRRVERDFRLRVDIKYERDGDGRIVIEDNAGGIARREFARAFKAAEVPPDRTGLSEFGMGMKSASIWFANNWRVTTTSVGDPNEYTVEFDMSNVLSENVERLDVAARPTDADAHFTRIELWNLNQHLPGRTLGKVRDHVREIYRGFLRDGLLDLTVAGQRMEYFEPEVLEAYDHRVDPEDPAAQKVSWRKPVELELSGGVRVTGWVAIRAEGKTSGNGLALFRRGRVIVGTSDNPYRPFRIYGPSNSYRSQRLFGELSIENLAVSHTKDGFQWHGLEEEFEETLRALLDSEPLPLLKQAENYRARQASRLERKRIVEATENTVRASQEQLPEVVETAALVPSEEIDDGSIRGEPDGQEITRTFSFGVNEVAWTVVLTAAARPAEPRWLVRHVDLEPRSGAVTAHLTINTGHPFIRHFALGSTDALEAVFRVAVAMVVSESLAHGAGDGESAALFMRRVDTLLGAALSKRVGGLGIG